MLRGLLGLLILVICFSFLISTPFIQSHLIKFASQQASKSLGFEVNVGEIKLNIASKSLSINDIVGKSEGGELYCKSYTWSKKEGMYLDSVIVSINSFSDLEKIILSKGINGEEGLSDYTLNRLDIKNIVWEIGGRLNGEISRLNFDDIAVSGSDFKIRKWLVENSATTSPDFDRLIIQKANVHLSLIDSSLDFQIQELLSEEGNITADIKFDKKEEKLITTLVIDGNASLIAQRFDQYLDNEILELISSLNSDTFYSEIIISDGDIIVDVFENDQIKFAGTLIKSNGEYDWAVDATIDSKLLEIWTGELIETAALFDVKAVGTDSTSAGSFSSNFTSGVYEIDWSHHDLKGGLELDSLWTESGILKNLDANFTYENKSLDIHWKSDLLNVNTHNNAWKITSHLYGSASINDIVKQVSLSFTNPTLLKNSSTPPLHFKLFNIDLQLNGQYLDVEIMSDLLDAKGVVNTQSEDWNSWLNSIRNKSKNFDGLLSNGVCDIHKAKSFCEILELPIELDDNTKAVWNISGEKYSAEIVLEQVKYGDYILENPVLYFEGYESEGGESTNSLNLRISSIEKEGELIISDVGLMVDGEEFYTSELQWKNPQEVEGLLRIEGSKREMWEFDLTQAIIPMGEDTLRFSKISGAISGKLRDPVIALSGEGLDFSFSDEIVPYTKFNLIYYAGHIKVDSKMSGLGPDKIGSIETKGNIKISSQEGEEEIRLDLFSNLNDIPLKYANRLLNEKTASLDGNINAEFTITGTTENPELNGTGQFKNAVVGVSYLGTEYYLSGNFNLLPYGIELNGLQVKDKQGGQAILVGTALHEGFKKWNIDVSLSIEDEMKALQIMNIPNSPDAYFYGTGNATGDVNVFGYDGELTIEARLKTTEGTEFVLPMETATSSSWSSFVEFAQYSSSHQLIKEEVKQKTSVNLDLIIDVTEQSKARIIFDEAVGDEIIGRCNGVIHLALDDLERLSMYGSLEIVEGDYLFTLYNIINKKFVAEPGGTIKWFGNPYEAEIDMKTSYSTRTSLLPITQEATSEGKQRVDLILNLNGNLMRPGIKFDIELPESDARTRASLATLVSNEEEMNRQAFSLLVLQQFLQAEWQAAAIGSTGIQENSTELISSQLGNWLSGISDDIDVGIDYDAGTQAGDESALAVALSTQLLNNRLHVEGEIGTDKLNTGPLEDLKLRDVRIRYDINKDGSIQLTGYSTQRSTIPGLEGESVQGVGILFHKDFNKLNELFKRKL